jgi:hypothetical protein
MNDRITLDKPLVAASQIGKIWANFDGKIAFDSKGHGHVMKPRNNPARILIHF